MTADAFEKLSRLKVGALFMETGTGKTKIALDLMAYKSHKADYLLWICPCSLKGEIERERRKWHPEMSFDVVGCESIGQSDRIYMDTLDKVRSHRSFVVVDESLKIKNAWSKRTQRIIEIGDCAEYKLILNGTPISRNVCDLWAQMEFLSPRILNMNKHDFDRRYVRYGKRKLSNGYERKVPIGSQNVDNVIGLISPYVFESKLEIESRKHYHAYGYALSDEEEEGYLELKRELMFETDANGLKDLRDIDFYRITTELQHYYCRCRDRERCMEKVLNDMEGKAVVFVRYLSSIPEGAMRITGGTKDRGGIIDEFERGDERLLYITYGCGAYGLNLQFCHNIVFMEHGFDYATRLQAEARIYRMGQTEDVHYYDMECDVGLERMFTDCIWKKSNMLQEIKSEIQKNGLKNL